MKKPKGGTAPADPPADAELADFTLSEAQSDQVRAAIGLDNDDPAEGRAHVAAAWTQIAAEMGFDPETLILHAGIPANGPIALRAKAAEPTGEAAGSGEVAQPEGAALSPEDQSIEDERKQLASDEAYDASLARMEAGASGLDLESSTLVGDLSEALLEILKRMPKPFDAHSVAEKRQLAASIGEISKTIARQAVDLVSTEGDISVRAIMEKISATDKVVVTLKLAPLPDVQMGEAIHNLYACLQKSVVIKLSDSDRHMGRRRELIPPDQDELPFDAGRDPAAAPAAPAGDTDLADAGDAVEVEDRVSPKATHRVVDPDPELNGSAPPVYLEPDGETWIEASDQAGVWPEAEAQELANQHNAEIEPKDAGQ